MVGNQFPGQCTQLATPLQHNLWESRVAGLHWDGMHVSSLVLHLLPRCCLPQKGKGDVKKKGQLDPYAYIPLNRAKLNRR